ncbi:hypothetical protein BRETT_004547 [Brettanomyces bruxellensis]|uniref:Uncharacterized protein n=1 Tax=Dekkera bruxellensis TaxID=5007 RepID=A0A871R9Y8_DEKBR|nr:uncharacterized protein BRETT_004547 [Brettanomyces bruxellensis]QOU19902.1 hypothetical protein BRETT_004547 [Brettanomyces bruxellensis]
MKEEISVLGYLNPLINGMKRKLNDDLSLSDETLLDSDNEGEEKDSFDLLFGAAKRGPKPKKCNSKTYGKNTGHTHLHLKIKRHRPSIADYFASGRRHKQNLAGELGFDLKTALIEDEAPTSMRTLEDLVEKEKNIDGLLKDDATEVRNAKEKDQQLRQYIKDNLDKTFINDPMNTEYIQNLEKKLENTYDSDELYDFYFVLSSGAFGSNQFTKKYYELRSRIVHGNRISLKDTEITSALGCLSEEMQPNCALQYLNVNPIHLDVQDLKTFVNSLGCEEQTFDKKDKKVKLMLNNKKSMGPQILVAIKMYVLAHWILSCSFSSELLEATLCDLIYLMVDARMSGTTIDESTIVNGCRMNVLQVLTSSFLELSKKCERILEIIKKCLFGRPFLWFRFIDNLVIFPGIDIPDRQAIINLRANCYMLFVNDMSFNDTTVNSDKPELKPKQDYSHLLKTKKDIYHHLVKLLRYLQHYKLRSDFLKNGPYEEAKKVNETNYLENREAYRIAKLRMLSLEKLCFSYIDFLRYGESKFEEKEIQKRLRKLKRHCMEIKHTYFHDFTKLVCPEITKSLSAISFICERAQSEMVTTDPF